MQTSRHAAATGRAAARSEWGQRLLHAGWAAKGVVYGIIALLALQIATGDGAGDEASQQGALQEVADKPFGTVLLLVLAVGLVGYAVGRAAEATVLARPDTGAADRVGYLVSTVAYLVLAVGAVSLALGSGSASGGSGEPAGITARVMESTAGRVLVGLVGLAILAAAASFVRQGVTKSFLDELRTSEMSPASRTLVERLGTVGLVARGVVFAVIGWFVVQAALQYDAREAKGLDGALREVADRAYGPILLGIVALGLLAYAAYCLANARWRRI